jgi:hypothetical protein
MADEWRMALQALLRKAEATDSGEFLRADVRVLAQGLMELEVSQHLGADRRARSSLSEFRFANAAALETLLQRVMPLSCRRPSCSSPGSTAASPSSAMRVLKRAYRFVLRVAGVGKAALAGQYAHWYELEGL